MPDNDRFYKRRVWVLGAGFAKPLGAPLFSEIFTEGSARLSRAAFSGREFAPYSEQSIGELLSAYEAGGGNSGRKQPPNRTDGIWSNAEQFIERLTLFAEGKKEIPKAAGFDRRLETPRQCEELLVAAKREFAAEVSEFLYPSPDMGSERWLSYRTWIDGLDDQRDAIVTFNYDTSVESLYKEVKSGEQLDVLVHEPQASGNERMLPMLKMHGSVDWRIKQNKEIERIPQRPIALVCKPEEIAIGVPGAHKKDLSDRYSWLWRNAETLFSTARSIHFVGYRMPETDGLALNKICVSLRKAFRSNHWPQINIVLGPSNTPDRARLVAIFERLQGSFLHRKSEAIQRDEIEEELGLRPKRDSETELTNRVFQSSKPRVHAHDMWAQDYLESFDFDDD